MKRYLLCRHIDHCVSSNVPQENVPLLCVVVEIHVFCILFGTGYQFWVLPHASHRRPGILLDQYGPKLNSLK